MNDKYSNAKENHIYLQGFNQLGGKQIKQPNSSAALVQSHPCFYSAKNMERFKSAELKAVATCVYLMYTIRTT